MIRGAATSAVLVLLAVACGGGGDGGDQDASSGDTAKPEAERSFEGAFAGTSLAIESTVKDDKNVGEERQTIWYLSCASKGCTKVHQRSSHEPERRTGGTWLFERDGNELVAVDVRTGACTAPATGEYTQRLTWTWVIGKDGAMTGELLQDFKGCDLDSTSRTKTTMGTDGKRLPYLADPSAIVAALNAYDDAFAVISAEYESCNAQTDDPATIVEGSECLERIVGTWLSGLGELEKAIAAGPPEDAPEKCREAWEELPAVSTVLDPATQARDAIATVNREGGDLGVALNEHLQAALTANEQFQPGLTLIAYSCISPEVAAADLGEEARLTFDTNQVLFANPEPASGG